MALNMAAAQADRMLRNAVETDVPLRRLRDGRYGTRSAKTPGGLTYLTTSNSCTCPGFQAWGRCKHVAAVRFEESFDGPEPSAPVRGDNAMGDRVCPGCWWDHAYGTPHSLPYGRILGGMADRDGHIDLGACENPDYPSRAGKADAPATLQITQVCPACKGGGLIDCWLNRYSAHHASVELHQPALDVLSSLFDGECAPAVTLTETTW